MPPTNGTSAIRMKIPGRPVSCSRRTVTLRVAAVAEALVASLSVMKASMCSRSTAPTAVWHVLVGEEVQELIG